MKYPKLRELKEAFRSLFSRPYTADFPRKPHEPFDRFRGKTKYYEEDCIGCGACFQVCPARAIEMQDIGNKRVLTVHWDLCIFCGQCQANCPTDKGIMLSTEFDISTIGKRADLKQTIEKEFAKCECCGENIVPIDQISWVAKRIGPLCFSNASLMLFYLRSLGLSLKDKFFPQNPLDMTRSDRTKILCPRCRREAVLKS